MYELFRGLVADVSPLLAVEQQFPEFTRHDPAHAIKLEVIAADIVNNEAVGARTAADLFALLCSLWIHDAGMGVDPIEVAANALLRTRRCRLLLPCR
jgi:EAL domain-containing protein (putative c-di-GMP-specific phosphodiesterase class I)